MAGCRFHHVPYGFMAPAYLLLLLPVIAAVLRNRWAQLSQRIVPRVVSDAEPSNYEACDWPRRQLHSVHRQFIMNKAGACGILSANGVRQYLMGNCQTFMTRRHLCASSHGYCCDQLPLWQFAAHSVGSCILWPAWSMPSASVGSGGFVAAPETGLAYPISSP